MRYTVAKDVDKSYRGCGHAVGYPGVAIFRGSYNEGYVKHDTAVQINLIMAFMSTKAKRSDEQRMTRHKEM